jgi:hypothetical protein
MSATRLLVLLLLTGLLAACAEPEPEPGPGESPALVTEELNPLGNADLVPPGPGADEGIRARRRMDLDQIAAALEVATGGQEWTDPDSGVHLFDALAPTLGQPDHIGRTERDLEPSMLFQKFMGDAARDVCEKMKDADLEATEPILMKHVGPDDDPGSNAAGVEANLRYLLLRFHSLDVDEGSELLTPWLDLFEAALTPPEGEGPTSPPDAWRTVCVGLVIHPNFYSY